MGNSTKKAIALSFLFLANAIMLTHAIIPHHHHNGVFFTLATAHHNHDCDSHNDHQNCDDTQSDRKCEYPFCDDNAEKCSLTTIYVKVSDNRQSFQLHDFDIDLLPCILTLLTDYNAPLIDDVGLPFRQNPYLQSYHTEYISQSLGWRAPPVC